MTPQPSEQPPLNEWDDVFEFIEALMNADLSYATLPITDEHLTVRDVIEPETWDREIAALKAKAEAAAPATYTEVERLDTPGNRADLRPAAPDPVASAAHFHDPAICEGCATLALLEVKPVDPVATPALALGGSPLDRSLIRAAISNAYYECREAGESMETAADRAANAVMEVAPDPVATLTTEALRLLNTAIQIIEQADHRASAADGPVNHVRDEMTDAEWRDLYVALTEARLLVASPASVEALAAALHEVGSGKPRCGPASTGCRGRHRRDARARLEGAVASPAPLDVERLARALWRLPNVANAWLKEDIDAAEFALAIAAAYAEGQPVAEEPTDAP